MAAVAPQLAGAGGPPSVANGIVFNLSNGEPAAQMVVFDAEKDGSPDYMIGFAPDTFTTLPITEGGTGVETFIIA